MGIAVITLTPEQIAQAQQSSDSIAAAAKSVVRPGQFVFFAAFDGTDNNRDNPAASGDPQMTNVGQLFGQVDSQRATNPNLAAKYYPGPGTPGTLPTSSWLSPQVTQQVINTGTQAYNDFAVQASNWLLDNPRGSVTAMVTSFSRGDASAAVFSQLLYEKGLVDPADGTVLIQPGQVGISAGLLYDPVTTGVKGSLAYPPNAKNIVVIAADNEYRYDFKADDYSGHPGITTIHIAGNHGDVGGCYDNGLGALTLKGGTEFFRNSGLAIADVPASRLFNVAAPVAIHSEGTDSYGKTIWSEYGSVQAGTTRLTQNPGAPATTEINGDGTTTTFVDVRGNAIKRTVAT